MRTTTQTELRSDALESVIAKIAPADEQRAEQIRALAKGSEGERELALWLALDVLTEFPS